MSPDHEDGPATRGSTPPPDERPWRHPAELFGRPEPRQPDPPSAARSPRTFLLVLLAIGAVSLGVRHLSASTPTDAAGDVPPPVGPATDLVSAETAPSSVAVLEIRLQNGDVRRCSAVWLDHDGLLVTASDAVRRAEGMAILDPDGRRHDVVVLGTDDQAEVAVLRASRTRGSVAVLSGRPLDPTSTARLETGDGESFTVQVTPSSSHTDRSPGDTAVGSVLVGPNDTIAALVVGVDGAELRTVPAPGLRRTVDRLLDDR